MVASLVIEQTVPLLVMSLSPRAGNGNNGQPLFRVHESSRHPDSACTSGIVSQQFPHSGVFQQPLKAALRGVSALSFYDQSRSPLSLKTNPPTFPLTGDKGNPPYPPLTGG